jgi:protoporphyrinogen/coproporphyrinogen III oxidase
MKVIVVGAGTAGLAATHALRGRGFDVTTLEKEGHAGGRISGARKDGFTMDLGAQFFTNYYEKTFDICRAVGLGDELVDYRLRSAAWRDGRMYPLELGRDLGATLRSAQYQPGGWLVRARLARMMMFLFRHRNDLAFPDFGELGVLDRESLADFAIKRYGTDVLEYFLQPAASSLSCAQPEDMCAAEGLSLTLHIVSGVFKGFKALGRGVGRLADALAADCGESIRCGSPARRIVIENGAVRGVETDMGFMEADAVVCATTATKALELAPALPDALRLPLEKVRYSACCHVMFALDRRLARERTYAVSIPRRSRSSIVSIGLDSAKSADYAPPGCEMAHCFTFASAAAELNGLPDDEVKVRIARDMRMFFEEFPPEPVFCEIYRWKEALCFYPPGMATALAEMSKRPGGEVRGLYLCGEYMEMPGTVEGAFRSALRTAQAVSREAS